MRKGEKAAGSWCRILHGEGSGGEALGEGGGGLCSITMQGASEILQHKLQGVVKGCSRSSKQL